MLQRWKACLQRRPPCASAHIGSNVIKIIGAGPVWSGGNSVFIASWLFGSPYPVHRWPRKISTHKQHGGSINFPCVAVKVTYKHYSGLFLIRIHFLNSDFDPSRNVQLPPIAYRSQFGTLLPLWSVWSRDRPTPFNDMWLNPRKPVIEHRKPFKVSSLSILFIF